MLQVGIIGCGKQAPKHITALQKLKIDKIFVSDIQPEAARELAGKYNILSYPDPEKLLQDNDINVIDICTPTPSHFDYARRALLSRKHVFCEKPLTPDIDEAAQLLALCRRQQRVGMVAFVYKYHPLFNQVKEAVDSGVLGTVRAIFMRLGGIGSHRTWKHQTESGGGVVNEMLSHMLDLLLWFVGDVGSIETVHLDNLLPNRRIEGAEVPSVAEDFALVVGKSVSGTKFVVESDLISPAFQNDIQILGSEGYVKFSVINTQESYIFLNQEHPPYTKGKTPLESRHTDLFELMFQDFLNRMQGQNGLQKNSFADSLRLAQLLQEIKRKGKIPVDDR
ncbi:MAG: gfo/Idh/MocA family oxidoreductase [Deltaproteobacteria bacterium]|nr:MAG: gfo/Idh/MocA family oxidoreductase [Deltaproteobacteria bacterium]